MTTPANPRATVSHVIVEDSTGQRIDNFLMRMLKGVPRTRVYRMLRTGEVRVDGKRVKAGFRVEDGQTIRIPPVRAAAAAPPARMPAGLVARLEAAVLFEDSGLIVLDKPAGLACHGGSGIRAGLIETLREARGNPRLELAHRLDRDTSGVLLIGKTRAAVRHLHDAFREGTVVKRYQAIVAGEWPARVRTVRFRLRRYETREGERRVRTDATGQSARTDVEVALRCARASWLSLSPHTGRTHQIRVHAAAVGHPVLGDDKYPTPASRALARNAGIEGLCLHARELRLTWDGESRRFASETPVLFDRGWAALEASG